MKCTRQHGGDETNSCTKYFSRRKNYAKIIVYFCQRKKAIYALSFGQCHFSQKFYVYFTYLFHWKKRRNSWRPIAYCFNNLNNSTNPKKFEHTQLLPWSWFNCGLPVCKGRIPYKKLIGIDILFFKEKLNFLKKYILFLKIILNRFLVILQLYILHQVSSPKTWKPVTYSHPAHYFKFLPLPRNQATSKILQWSWTWWTVCTLLSCSTKKYENYCYYTKWGMMPAATVISREKSDKQLFFCLLLLEKKISWQTFETI